MLWQRFTAFRKLSLCLSLCERVCV